MVEYTPPPEPRTLLPPFLACLPTAFASRRPPPALLPLLSPILRQRVQLLTSNSSSISDSWLRLLCWDSEKAEQLQGIVEAGTFEPHPVSGEIEIENVDAITYRQLDEETLQAQIPLPEWGFTVVYLWCVGDQEGVGNEWRVAELIPYENVIEGDSTWSSTVTEANEVAKERVITDALRDAEPHNVRVEEDNDDDYWAQYDNTPGRTPAMKKSPAPRGATTGQRTSEAAHYAQYGQVQPAMDNHDPSEQTDAIGESSLNGDALASIMRRQSQSLGARQPPPYSALGNLDSDGREEQDISQPQPSTPSSTGSNTIARLEQSAESQSASEIGVKQHISTNIKSLYRLSKSAGMERGEFEGIVQRELEVLSMVDQDE